VPSPTPRAKFVAAKSRIAGRGSGFPLDVRSDPLPGAWRSPVLERSLHQLANFSWLVTALAGRDEVQVIKWWAGVTDFARDEAGASMAAEMDADPELLGNVAESVFHLPRAEESLVQMGALGPRGARP
jgi:hypothetical protein